MEIYIILFFIVVSGFLFNTNKTKQNKLTYLYSVFGCLIVVAALRAPTVGIDLEMLYAPYYPQYANVSWDNIQSVTASGHWEWGFCAFCKALCILSKDEQLFIAASSIVSIIPYSIFIYKNSRDVVFSTFFYVAFHVYMISLNIVRQSIAIGIILLGYEFLKRKQYTKYIIIVVIASLFHTSAIIALILILFDRVSYKKSYSILAFVGMFAFSFIYSSFFQWILGEGRVQEQYAFYEIGQGHFQGFITYHTLGMFVISLFIFLVMSYNVSKQSRRKDSILMNRIYGGWSYSILIYAVMVAMFFRFAAFFANVTSRISYYFIPFIMIAFPYVMNEFSYKKRKLLRAAMFCALTIFYFIVLTRAKETWGTVPFEWCNKF